MMELLNSIYEIPAEPESASAEDIHVINEAVVALVLMLAPFAPHISEELFAVIVGNEKGILGNGARFPEYNEEYAKADEIEVAVQVNGKLRSRVFASPAASGADLEALALADERVIEHMQGKEIVKVVVVPGRLVNIVVKG
jgi:leucyl-tRNA synthetase